MQTVLPGDFSPVHRSLAEQDKALGQNAVPAEGESTYAHRGLANWFLFLQEPTNWFLQKKNQWSPDINKLTYT